MALCGIGSSPGLEGVEKWCFGGNLSTRLMIYRHFNGKPCAGVQRRGLAIQCSSSRKVVSEGSVKKEESVAVEEESDSGHVIRFKMGDFKILDRVSIGLSGRADEAVFEAIVNDSNSPLYNTRVVLRRLTSPQAQRRGRRAIEVLKKLVRQTLMYHSYSMQVHGYVSSHASSGRSSFTLVDGVGILGNAADFYKDGQNSSTMDSSIDRRQMMIAFDMRCVGFMMAKMVLRELMDPLIFTKFKSFLTKGNDPSCLREFLLQVLNRNSSSGNIGLQILDRNWGAGWNLLSLLLATKSSNRISCLDALRHPFLCGPRWRVDPSIDMIRWGLGSTAVRISEEYIYRQPQRARLAYFIELMEMLNPHSKPKNWLEFLPGKWRMLYCTGRHIGLTLRQPPTRILVGDVHLTITRPTKLNTNLSFTSDIAFTVLAGQEWPHDKTGIAGKLQINSLFRLMAGRRLYIKEENKTPRLFSSQADSQNSLVQKLSSRKWRKAVPFKEIPSSLSVAKLVSGDIEVTMSLGHPLNRDVDAAEKVVQEVRTQVPPEMFDLSKFVCGTYVDSRFLVLRGMNGSALLFTRSCV